MRVHPLLFGLVLAACTDGPADPNPGGSGELGVGIFTYLCRGSGDFACALTQVSAPFPQAFAVGGRFGLSYAWKDEQGHINEPLPALQPAAPELLLYTSETFTPTATGYAAILARTGNSVVVDLIHALVRDIDDLCLVDTASLPTLTPLTDVVLAPGGTTSIQLVPLDLNDVGLAGALDVSWTLTDGSIASLVSGQGGGRVLVEALVAGTTDLTATVGDKLVTVTITVDPELAPTTTEPTSTTDFTSSTTATTDASSTADTTTDTTGGVL